MVPGLADGGGGVGGNWEFVGLRWRGGTAVPYLSPRGGSGAVGGGRCLRFIGAMKCFARGRLGICLSGVGASRVLGIVLKDYSAEGFFDEMVTETGKVRRHYQRFAQRLNAIGPEEFEHRRRAVDLAFLRQGITFNVYGDSKGAERIFPFDLVPWIIPASEWELIEAGLAQRITALNLFLHDIYHEQRIVKDG